jgi:hypothetical protein
MGGISDICRINKHVLLGPSTVEYLISQHYIHKTTVPVLQQHIGSQRGVPVFQELYGSILILSRVRFRICVRIEVPMSN